jgi:hypothetical protein
MHLPLAGSVLSYKERILQEILPNFWMRVEKYAVTVPLPFN